MKLYRAQITFEMLVLAENEDQAGGIAEFHAVEELESLLLEPKVEEFKEGDPLPEGWDEECEVYGPDMKMAAGEAIVKFVR